MSELHLGPRGLIEVQRGRASLARGRWLVAGRRVAEEEGCGGFEDPVLWNAPSQGQYSGN